MVKKAELAFFVEIWRERIHKSEISGTLLMNFEPCYFSHVIPKGSRPDLRLNKLNIVLMTYEEHQLWEFSRHKLVEKPEWKWVFDLMEFLKTR